MTDIKVSTSTLVSITEANQNFSKVAKSSPAAAALLERKYEQPAAGLVPALLCR